MSEPVNIGKSLALANLLRYAEVVTTDEGNTYYRFPYWFELAPGTFEFIAHHQQPADLNNFMTKSGLGGDNPKPKPPQL